MKKETLIFKRMAIAAKDGKTGVIYIHSWGTGFQELIFDSHSAAIRYRGLLNNPEKLATQLNKQVQTK